jgi:plastocyanin
MKRAAGRLRAITKSITFVSLSLACLLGAGLGNSRPALAATHTIIMEGVVFVPATLTIKQGDTVIWINKDPFPHTATAQDKSFDSSEIATDKSWSHTGEKVGKFPYVCTLHPTMKGTLIVE